jgi:hypothetical protein
MKGIKFVAGNATVLMPVLSNTKNTAMQVLTPLPTDPGTYKAKIEVSRN